MRRFIYGDSFGDVGNRELATDAARDSRYFNALSSNRADQQLADSEVNAADESNQRWAGLADAAAARDAAAQQFGQTLGIHTGQLDLEKAKFAHQVAEPTAAELRDKERRFELAQARHDQDFSDAQTFHLSGDIAKVGNELNDVNSQITDLTHKKDLYDQSMDGFVPNMPLWMGGHGAHLPTWLGGVGTRGDVAASFVRENIPSVPAGTSVDPSEVAMYYKHALSLLTERKERLQTYINNATAKGANVDLYNLDEHGNYTPTFRPRNPANPFITRHLPSAPAPAPELQGRSFSAAIGGSASPPGPAWLQPPGTPGIPTPGQSWLNPAPSNATFIPANARQWSTSQPPSDVGYPDGTVLRSKSTNRVFVVQNGQLVPQ